MKKNVIVKNFSTRIILTILNIAIGFFATPLLLKYLGHEDYSLFKLTYDWLSSISFLEQILTSSALGILATLSDSNRDHYTHYAFKKFVKVSFIFLGLSILMIPFLPHLFTISDNKINEVRIGFFIGSIGFLFLPVTILRTWIEFHEKSYLLNMVRSLQNIFQVLVAIFLAYLAYGIIGQFVAFLIGQFILATFIYLFFKKTHNKDEVKVHHSDITEFDKALRKNNINSLTLSLSSKLSFLSDTLILGFFFKPIDILPFSLTQKLTQMVQENIQNLGNSSWATLASLQRAEKHQEFEDTLISLTRVTIFMSIVMTIPILFLNHSFIALWVGEKFYAGDTITTIAILNTYFMGIFSLWGWCLSGTGKIKAQIPIYTINAIINFTTALIFIKLVGISGPIIGTLIGFLTAYLFLIPQTLAKEFTLDASKLRRVILIPTIYLIIPILLNLKFKDLFLINSYLKIAIYFVIIAIISMVTMALTYLNSNERNYIWNLLLKRLNLKIPTR